MTDACTTTGRPTDTEDGNEAQHGISGCGYSAVELSPPGRLHAHIARTTRSLARIRSSCISGRQGKSQPYNQNTEDVLPEPDGVSALQSYRALQPCDCKRCRFVTDLDLAVGYRYIARGAVASSDALQMTTRSAADYNTALCVLRSLMLGCIQANWPMMRRFCSLDPYEQLVIVVGHMP